MTESNLLPRNANISGEEWPLVRTSRFHKASSGLCEQERNNHSMTMHSLKPELFSYECLHLHMDGVYLRMGPLIPACNAVCPLQDSH